MSDGSGVSRRELAGAERRRSAWRRATSAAALITLLLGGAAARAQTPSGDAAPQDPSRIEQLEREVESLRQAIEALRAQQTHQQQQLQAPQPPAAAQPAPAAPALDAAELARRIDVLAAEVERMKLGEAAVTAERAEAGFGPAASKVYRTGQGFSIGGYGEVVYQRFDDRRDDGIGSGRIDRADALRAIVYLGYKFDDKWLFNSEVEFEHGGRDTFLEFAYLDYAWRPGLGFRFGHLLLPMGFVNELHEPTVFLGTNRPTLERVLLPSTWHENGAGIFGDLGAWSYRSYLVNGMNAGGFTAAGLRSGRQGGIEAKAEDVAWVSKLEGTPIEGVRVGGAAYLGKSGQDLRFAGRDLDVSTRIYELHGEWRWRGLQARALAARASRGDVARRNGALGRSGAASVGEEMRGHYAELGYDVWSHRGGGRTQLIPFVRWEQVDTQHEVPAGFRRNLANDQEILTYGLSWLPQRQLVFKLDFQDFDNEAGSGTDQLNLGVGYVF